MSLFDRPTVVKKLKDVGFTRHWRPQSKLTAASVVVATLRSMTMARSEIRCKTFTPRWLITRNFLGQSRGRFSSSPVVAVLLLRPLPALTGLPCTSPLLPPRLVAGEKEVAQRVITPFIGHGDQLCMFVFSLQGTTKMLLPLSILQLLLAPALAVKLPKGSTRK